MPSVRSLGLRVVVLVSVLTLAEGAIVTLPAGLQPGDTYRLAFFTSTVRGPTSSSIDDYNSFVAGVANSVPALKALDTTWKALVSTPDVDALANIGAPFSEPIYNTLGQMVAAGSSGLYCGYDCSLLASIYHERMGDPIPLYWVLTGTDPDGHALGPMGNHSLVFGVGYGDAGEIGPGFGWTASALIDASTFDADTFNQIMTGHIYGLSGPVTVPAPEPSTVALSVLGAAGLLEAGRRSKRK